MALCHVTVVRRVLISASFGVENFYFKIYERRATFSRQWIAESPSRNLMNKDGGASLRFFPLGFETLVQIQSLPPFFWRYHLAVRMFVFPASNFDSNLKALLNLNANVAKLAYAKDLKSFALKKVYRFKSDRSHQKKRLDVRVA